MSYTNKNISLPEGAPWNFAATNGDIYVAIYTDYTSSETIGKIAVSDDEGITWEIQEFVDKTLINILFADNKFVVFYRDGITDENGVIYSNVNDYKNFITQAIGITVNEGILSYNGFFGIQCESLIKYSTDLVTWYDFSLEHLLSSLRSVRSPFLLNGKTDEFIFYTALNKDGISEDIKTYRLNKNGICTELVIENFEAIYTIYGNSEYVSTSINIDAMEMSYYSTSNEVDWTKRNTINEFMIVSAYLNGSYLSTSVEDYSVIGISKDLVNWEKVANEGYYSISFTTNSDSLLMLSGDNINDNCIITEITITQDTPTTDLNIEYLKLEVGKKATENIPDVKQSASNVDVLSDKFANRDLLNVLEELKDTEISTGQIANGAVTKEKIADGVLTATNTSVAEPYDLPSGQAKNVENVLKYLDTSKWNKAEGEYWATETFSNPNLLINSNFKNPVNLNGKTEYTEQGEETITGWKITSFNTTISLTDDGLLFSQASGAYARLENLNRMIVSELENLEYGEAIYATVEVDGIEYNGIVSYKNQYSGVSFGDNCRIFSIPNQIMILEVNSGHTIGYVDFELGAYTKYISKPYVEELQNCLMYNDSGEVQVPYVLQNLVKNGDFRNPANSLNTTISGTKTNVIDGWTYEAGTSGNNTFEVLDNNQGVRLNVPSSNGSYEGNGRFYYNLDENNMGIPVHITLGVDVAVEIIHAGIQLIVTPTNNIVTVSFIPTSESIRFYIDVKDTTTLTFVNLVRGTVRGETQNNKNIAGNINLTDANNNFTATTVEGALAELAERIKLLEGGSV